MPLPVRSPFVSIAVAAVAAVTAVTAGCGDLPAKKSSDDALSASNVPAAIAVPTGNKLAFQFRASGVQNYECRAKADAAGGYDWTFVFPEASLYDRTDTLVGRHYAGPTWEYSDDSKVTGKVVADSPAPRPGNIAWLLLQGTPGPRNGVMSGVTYIQRVNTDGGVTPSDACTAATAASKKAVKYSADYLFYKG